MLNESLERINDMTKRTKDAVLAGLKEQDYKNWQIVKFSDIEDGILSAVYYSTGNQLRLLSNYVESESHTLQAIATTFKSIVDTGVAGAFPNRRFNKATREVIGALL